MHPKKPVATCVAWKLRDVQHRHMQTIHGILEKYELHWGQPRILHAVAEGNGATQAELAERLQISAASVAMSVKRLEKNALVEKCSVDSDLRVKRIRLTAKGKRMMDESWEEIVAADARLLKGFSAADIQALTGFLDRLYQNLEPNEEFKT